MRRHLSEAENTLSDSANGQHIELWVDGSDHMQFKCKVCGEMMNLLTSPNVSKYRGAGGAIYLTLFCRPCNEIHSRKIYFGMAANEMKSSVELRHDKQ